MRAPVAEVHVVALLIAAGCLAVPDTLPSKHFVRFDQIDTVRQALGRRKAERLQIPVSMAHAEPAPLLPEATMQLARQLRQFLKQAVIRGSASRIAGNPPPLTP